MKDFIVVVGTINDDDKTICVKCGESADFKIRNDTEHICQACVFKQSKREVDLLVH